MHPQHPLVAARTLIVAITLLMVPRLGADDWPTYGHDRWRSSSTAEALSLPLRPRWIHRPQHLPVPAWPAPAKADYWHYKENLQPRETYDHAFHVIAADGRIFWGSSADDQVTCLDASTGQIRWTYFTDGPVRLAPTLADNRLFVGSDDGNVHCLSPEDGHLIWKTQVGPSPDQCLGNGRMISRWPVRSGVLVHDKLAYCAAGVFPEGEGAWIVGLDITNGVPVLRQSIEQSAQGYMVASDRELLFPTGRSSPSVFDIKTGKFLNSLKSSGGAYTVVTEHLVVAGRGDTTGELSLIEPTTREQLLTFDGLHVIARDTRLFVMNRTTLSALDRVRFVPLARRSAELRAKQSEAEDLPDRQAARSILAELKPQLAQLRKDMESCWLWRTPCDHSESLILAGETLFAGGNGHIQAIDAQSGQPGWSTQVEGRVCGLVVANGRLLVSTDLGHIHCFENQLPDSTSTEQANVTESSASEQKVTREPSPVETASLELVRAWRDAAQCEQGFALLLGGGQFALASGLASQTRLQLVLAESDPQTVATIRRDLAERGVYGVRAAAHTVSLDQLPYPPYFANCVLVDPNRFVASPDNARQLRRMMRPLGGWAWLGPFTSSGDPAAESWRKLLVHAGFEVHDSHLAGSAWIAVQRGQLEGAGEWTHGLADPSNSTCTYDQRVKGTLRIQWFGEPGPRPMADRHHRNVTPLFKQGRLFVPGENLVVAVDAYNGTNLWKREFPNSLRLGAFLDCSNYVVDDEALYVAVENRCEVLNVADGTSRGQLQLPVEGASPPRHWGFLARIDDLLIGSSRKPEAAYSRQSRADDISLWYDSMALVTSDTVFGLNLPAGQPRWSYGASSVIINTTLVIGGDRIYFVESRSPEAVRNELGRMPMSEFLTGPNDLVALDVHTGKEHWRVPISLEDCRHIIYATYAQDKLIISGNRYIDRKLWYFYQTVNAADGQTVWTASHNSGYDIGGDHGEQNRIPTVIGDTIYTYPVAYDLHTGVQRTDWQFDRLGHGCGNISASAHCIFWRGGNPWQWDLASGEKPRRVNNVTRPGCFINMLPVGGLLLIPEASSGCTCSFPLQTSLAYVPEGAE
jgi:outer membrane protein assembly factor BamB